MTLAVLALLLATAGDEFDAMGAFGDAQPEIAEGARLHGSFENQLTAQWLRSPDAGYDLMVYDAVRLRLDLDADLPGGLTLRSDGVARLFAGEVEAPLASLIPRRAQRAALAESPLWATALDQRFRLEDEAYVDNAYVKIPAGDAAITVGKQPVHQGAGYAWNPTDPFTAKDIFDPTYEKPGVVAGRVVLPLGQRAGLDLLVVHEEDAQNWAAGGRASLRFGPVSASAVGYRAHLVQPGVEAVRVLAGGDAVLDLHGVRLWAEGAHNWIDSTRGAPGAWWEGVAGAEYFLGTETHPTAEYFHYGRGATQRDGAYPLADWLLLLDGRVEMLGRDFAFEAIDHPVADFWTVGLSSFQSISDGSVALLADARWTFAQDAELWLVLTSAVGDRDDALSTAQGPAWLRLTVDF